MSDPEAQQQFQSQSSRPTETGGNSTDNRAVSPEELQRTVTTEAEELWKQNEQLLYWSLEQKQNTLVRTVPGGGKSYFKEVIVPQLAAETENRFVLATTEYRNRQETYRQVLETLVDQDLVDDVNVVYIPAPRECYGEIPQLHISGDGGWEVTTPDDDEAVCQTFTKIDGEYVEPIAGEIDEIVQRGTTTGAVHKAASSEWEQVFTLRDPDYEDSPLVCQQRGIEKGYDPADPHSEPACRHRRMMKRRLQEVKNGDADIVICGASLLYQEDIVRDAIVIADEDVSSELVRKYPESYLENAVENYLTGIEPGPNTYRSVGRRGENERQRTISYILENHGYRSDFDDEDNKEPLVNRQAPVKSEMYHYERAEAPLLTLGWLAGEKTDETDHLVYESENHPYRVTFDLQRNNTNNNHKMVAMTNPPSALQYAKQVIALDATGSEVWWERLTGVEFESVSPNPRDKRGTVVSEAFNIEFRSLTEKMVALSRPNNLSARQFLAILQAIVDHHDADEVSVVTSKAMRRKVKNSEYVDDVMELAYADEILYFGGLRSERTFEDSRLHVVIGAPHPGDDAVRQRMALLNYDDRIVQNIYSVRGEDRYKGNALTVLNDIVHSEVYQAARRAARSNARYDTAYVYLYTRMFDEAFINADDSYRVDILGQGEHRDGGTEAIFTVLDSAEEPLETVEVVSRVNNRLKDGESLSRNRVREKLQEMTELYNVEEQRWIGRRKRWWLETSPRHGTLIARET
ncbi:putative helicase fused to HTH domain [Halalkaliarchaeum sp. AArc-CO]|uniref:hypothetical protein n=1 Tax=Halalkaliarchaeum sp. AArc-CO TaxID=2866381 RepID=UPI00217E2D85|nr:hypothetical protein [Halalkaliarchaeum sp. AArc-CO]UWG50696.1 putative helicase fused to HTH domain [Halalkaliarchaeum sp. AArc-CO]